MTEEAQKICDSIAAWIRQSLLDTEAFDVEFEDKESWNSPGRYVTFKLRSGEKSTDFTCRAESIEEAMISEHCLKCKVWSLLGRFRGLS